jgi:drug/metabolite transporter (DMT)-like permease
MQYHIGFLVFVTLVAARNVFSADLLEETPPMLLAFIVGVVVITAAVTMRLSTIGTRIDYNVKKASPYFLLLGISTAMGVIGANMALSRISPVLLSMIDVIFYPVLSSILAAAFAKGETVNLKIVLPLLFLGIAGILLFSYERLTSDSNLDASLAGMFWTFFSVVGWAGSIISVANLVRSGTPIPDVIGMRFSLMTVLLFCYLLLTNGLNVQVRLLPIVGVALFTYFVPFILLFSGLRKLPVVTFAIYAMLGPIMTYLLSALILGREPLSTLQWMGASLVFTALILRVLWESYHVTGKTTAYSHH